MKHFNYLFVTLFVALFASCTKTYYYTQVFETKPVEGQKLESLSENSYVYDDGNCIVNYYLWDESGNPGFMLTNNTDSIIYIDKTKSFFVKNGVAHSYFLGREWHESSTKSHITSSGSSGSVAVAGLNFFGLPMAVAVSDNKSTTLQSSKTTGATKHELQLLAVPPHASVLVNEYEIYGSRYLNCGLEQFPQTTSLVEFGEENTPVRFGNYITYRVGNSGNERNIENDFLSARSLTTQTQALRFMT